jgi:hypothetical protein
MTAERANDLVAFKKFIDGQLSNGGAELKLDEALARWKYENQTHEERQEALEAIQEGLQSRDGGKSRPVHEVLAELRNEHGFASTANTLQDNPDQWAHLLQAWVSALPMRSSKMNDSRESIYAGRGE